MNGRAVAARAAAPEGVKNVTTGRFCGEVGRYHLPPDGCLPPLVVLCHRIGRAYVSLRPMELCPATVVASIAARPVFGLAMRGGLRRSAALVTLRRGFTIVELLIVIAIAAILATIAVPSFRDMLRTTRQNSALGLVINDLNLARGEAIKRNSSVLVCASNATGDDCAVTGAWQGGWVVCLEASIANTCLNTTGAIPPNPNPITVRPALDSTMTLTASSTDPFRFRPNSTATQGTLVLSGSWSGALSRTVAVAGTGNISKQ